MNYNINDILEVLSESTSDELFNKSLLFFTEKATREQYRLSAFKKKYKYDPKEKTIIVDGEKYKVDLDIKNPYIVKDGNKVKLRIIETDDHSDDPIIYLDDIFFKLKNTKRRESILQHEIGHLKLHNTNPDSKYIDKGRISEKYFDDVFNNKKLHKMTIDTLYHNKINPVDYGSLYDKVYEDVCKYVKNKRTKYLELSTLNDIEKQMRDDIYLIAKKYENNNNEHNKAIEFEADRYAANKVSDGDTKKALREYNKKKSAESNIRRDIKNEFKLYNTKNIHNIDLEKQRNKELSDKNIKKRMKDQHIKDKSSYETRVKALNDKELKKL